LKIREKDAVVRFPTPTKIHLRGKDVRDAAPPEGFGSSQAIYVGDAKKVFEKFFKKRPTATSTADKVESTAGTRHPVSHSSLRK
jgi:hypothetical protein